MAEVGIQIPGDRSMDHGVSTYPPVASRQALLIIDDMVYLNAPVIVMGGLVGMVNIVIKVAGKFCLWDERDQPIRDTTDPIRANHVQHPIALDLLARKPALAIRLSGCGVEDGERIIGEIPSPLLCRG